jgi:hypothetical protein
MKIGRNEPCPCGSGKKYKNCCLAKKSSTPLAQKLLVTVFILLIIFGLIAFITAIRSYEPSSSTGQGQGQVWSEEHQHWH